MVAAIDLAGNDRGQVAPDQAEHGVVDEQRVDPGDQTALGGRQIAVEDGVHAVGSGLQKIAAYGHGRMQRSMEAFIAPA
jgi:hypothetical protein